MFLEINLSQNIKSNELGICFWLKDLIFVDLKT